jgi:hypothetical protein
MINNPIDPINLNNAWINKIRLVIVKCVADLLYNFDVAS